MSGIIIISRKTGHCSRCNDDRPIYFMPGQDRREVTCRRCRLPLSFGEPTMIEVWKTGSWIFLPITRKVTPIDLPVFLRREELMNKFPLWEQRSLGLVPTRLEHDLAVIWRTQSRCLHCRLDRRQYCLTEFSIRRLTCPGCGKALPKPSISRYLSGLTPKKRCCIIGSLKPLFPVIVDKPSDLSVMSNEDLDILGLL